MRRLCLPAILPFALLGFLASLCQAQADKAASGLANDSMPPWERRLLAQFESKLYASLQEDESGCVDCHSSDGTSALVLSGNPIDDLRLLLDNRYLEATGPDSLWGRISSENPDRRMPKDSHPWPPDKVKQLRRFVGAVAKLQEETGVRADERFPRSLLQPYPIVPSASKADDNRFISYRQLIGKSQTIFQDDWVRGDRDLFAENVAMFGGADFETRFNEATEPNATFLTALEALSRDVSTRAYQRHSGPFSDWREPESDPRELDQVDELHRKAISTLFERILYRRPTEAEVDQALVLLCGVRELESQISVRDSSLVFELTVTNPETAQTASRTIEIPVSGDRLEVRQVVVDQRSDDGRTVDVVERMFRPIVDQLAMRLVSAPANPKLMQAVLAEHVMLRPDEPNQRVVLHNISTHRNVSFAGVEIRDANGELVSAIDADSPTVQVEGAWKLEQDDGIVSYEDGNNHKGLSSITVPLTLPPGRDEAGDYQVVLLWRANPDNTSHALVQLFAEGASNQLRPVIQPVVPQPGTASFSYDCTDDTAPFHELEGNFQLDAESYLEISNAGTSELVTAGAVEFLPESEDLPAVLIDSQDAEGRQAWSEFDEGRFKAYNVKGKKIHDDNRHKGELSLIYRPGVPFSEVNGEASDGKGEGWREGENYRVRIYYPGKRDQETRVPVKVVAKRSSPIVQVSHPVIAKADALLRLDASASYTVQGSPLQFSWTQVSGTPVQLADATSAAIEFTVPRLSSRQLAWTALCSALMRHPDFLFTRPPSLPAANASDKRSLQLVQLAQDLVGRSPTQEEIALMAAGQSYEQFVDSYLESQEFRDFYFHRIRLYMESQGTIVQDEPARLWCHVAFEDRPFQEILTADYTVDEDLQRIARPDYHGKTGVLTTKGFIQGKPGLPHYNYSAQVSMMFLGYVYEVPPEIVEQREGVTALGTTDPDSTCYSCHKILTPLAFQRLNWTDEGKYRTVDDDGLEIDASDRGAVDEYPFAGEGLEAFATQAVRKERFIRTMINTHVSFYFGRPLRHREDERELYQRLWDNVHENEFRIRELIRALVTSDEYSKR